MNKTFKHPILCYDIVFKTIFTKNPNLLVKLISDITGKSLEEITKISKNN